MEELKPCPFCGGEAVVSDEVCVTHIIDASGAYVDAIFEDLPVFVSCKQCKSKTFGFATSEEAIEAWNRRAK